MGRWVGESVVGGLLIGGFNKTLNKQPFSFLKQMFFTTDAIKISQCSEVEGDSNTGVFL